MTFDEPAAGAFAGLDRPHTHDYTALAVSGASGRTAPFAWPRPGRARTAAAPFRRGSATPEAALKDVTPHDDALASAWYRAKVLPVLVRRVLDDLEESA